MQISISKLFLFISGLFAVALVAASGYIIYLIFFTGIEKNLNPTVSTINIAVYGTKIGATAAALADPSKKISLNLDKDLAFIKSDLYKSFSTPLTEIPLSDSRGRANPFVPYVAP